MTDGKTAKYTFKTDDNGNYKGEGIAPGTYTIIYRNADTPPHKTVDQFSDVKLLPAPTLPRTSTCPAPNTFRN